MSMAETAHILDSLERLRDACHRNSVEHGFWDEAEQNVQRPDPNHPGMALYGPMATKPWNFGEKVALLHSELSEMFEAWRKNLRDSDKDVRIIDPSCRTKDDPVGTRRLTCVEEEMADVFIRLLDLAGKLKIDVGRVILAKMEYNRGRPHMHGGRKC